MKVPFNYLPNQLSGDMIGEQKGITALENRDWSVSKEERSLLIVVQAGGDGGDAIKRRERETERTFLELD